MEFQVGQKCKVLKLIEGAGCWINKGDIVTVIGVYPHHVMVQRSYKGHKGMMRQCFCRNGIEWELLPEGQEPPLIKDTKRRYKKPNGPIRRWTPIEDRMALSDMSISEVASILGRTYGAVRCRRGVLRRSKKRR